MQTMFLEMIVKGMHDCIPVETSRNVPMTSIMVCHIIKAPEINFAAPETGHDIRRLVIMTGAYLVITFGY